MKQWLEKWSWQCLHNNSLQILMELQQRREDRERPSDLLDLGTCEHTCSLQRLSSNGLSGLMHFNIPFLRSLRIFNNYFALSRRGGISYHFRIVVLILRQFCSEEDIWQSLETFLAIAREGGELLGGRHWRCWKYPTAHKTAPHNEELSRPNVINAECKRP